jgi:hypothetical protein
LGIAINLVWRHNHSQAKWDQDILSQYVLTPGETMPRGTYIEDAVEGQTMEFVYMNAGYIKPREGESSSHWSKVTIDPDEVRIYRDNASVATLSRPFWNWY